MQCVRRVSLICTNGMWGVNFEMYEWYVECQGMLRGMLESGLSLVLKAEERNGVANKLSEVQNLIEVDDDHLIDVKTDFKNPDFLCLLSSQKTWSWKRLRI